MRRMLKYTIFPIFLCIQNIFKIRNEVSHRVIKSSKLKAEVIFSEKIREKI